MYCYLIVSMDDIGMMSVSETMKRDHEKGANRHLSIPEQHVALTRRIRGHFNYFGVNGNHRSLSMLRNKLERSWFRWLRRRSQRTRMTWERFRSIMKDFPLPPVKVYKNLWTAP